MTGKLNKFHFVILGLGILLIAYAMLHDLINGRPFDFGILQWIVFGIGVVLLLAACCGRKILDRLCSWVGRHKPQFILCMLSIIVSLILVEVALRILGGRPGYIPNYGDFSPVERLEVDQRFSTGADGIFKANLNYDWGQQYSINESGFRDAAQGANSNSDAPSMLIIGDSFTWGMSAEPITESFADNISREGFKVHNMGIPGVGTSQYALIAKEYIPTILPDLCIVVFYMGNDFEKDITRPFQNMYHDTNAGFLRAHDGDGNYKNPAEAYKGYYDMSNAFRSTNELSSLMSRTVCGTYIFYGWGRFLQSLRSPAPDGTPSKNKNLDELKNTKLSELSELQNFPKENILSIKKVCESHGIPMILTVIPVSPANQHVDKDWMPKIDDHREFLAPLGARIPDMLDASDYLEASSHFNNQGHRKYADFLLKQIKETLMSESE